MVPRATVEYDMTGLNHLVSALDGALFANGHDGDIHRVLKTEAGQLAWDISQRLGPSEKSIGDRKAASDVKEFLTPLPRYSNLDPDQQYSSTADFTWLAAGPNFLLGIWDEDNQVKASADDAMLYLRAGQENGSRGKAYVDLGERALKGGGNQHVLRLNRTRVSKSVYRAVLAIIQGKVGSLRASFAWTAARLIPGKRIPGWIAKHFASEVYGKSVFRETGLAHPTEPFIEFGSRAKGVESQPKIAQAIDAGVENRKHLVAAKIKRVFAGYAYDWNTGRVFRRREAQEEEN